MAAGDESSTRGYAAVVRDIAEGFLTLNPITLKKFDERSYKGLHQQLRKLKNEIRAEKFPFHDRHAIRSRNVRLQRLYQAQMTLEHQARLRRIVLV